MAQDGCRPWNALRPPGEAQPVAVLRADAQVGLRRVNHPRRAKAWQVHENTVDREMPCSLEEASVPKVPGTATPQKRLRSAYRGWLRVAALVLGGAHSILATHAGSLEKESAVAPPPPPKALQQINPPFNRPILDALQLMPTGGGYRASADALAALHMAIQSDAFGLRIRPERAEPSFCSAATYLVFLQVLVHLQAAHVLGISPATTTALAVGEHQPDGNGAWGRWNANGPGTARFFYELNLGPNFTSFDDAVPGDFLKIFWNDQIGVQESGHSVVYLGRTGGPSAEFVRYWSCNQPNGYGIATVPRTRIRRALFSRLEHPEAINQVSALRPVDEYLAGLLKRSSTPGELVQMTGLRAHVFPNRGGSSDGLPPGWQVYPLAQPGADAGKLTPLSLPPTNAK